MTPDKCLCGCGETPPYNPRRNAYNKYVNNQHRDRYKDRRRQQRREAEIAARPAPLCGCGCGQTCGRTPNSPTGYLKYVDATHRYRAEYQATKATVVRRCLCGCGERVFLQRRYVNETHRQRTVKRQTTPTAQYDLARIPGDLTAAQIDRIINDHRARLRYERNRTV